jgi:hypothetical protein
MRHRAVTVFLIDCIAPALAALSLGPGLVRAQSAPSPGQQPLGMPASSPAWSGYVMPRVASASSSPRMSAEVVRMPAAAEPWRAEINGQGGPAAMMPSMTPGPEAVTLPPTYGQPRIDHPSGVVGPGEAPTAYGSCWSDGGCPPSVPMPHCVAPSSIAWGGGAGPLFLFRDDSNHEFFSYDSAIETNQYLDSRDAYDDFLPGVEAHVARFDMCTCTGWEAAYWGVFPSDVTTYVYDTDVTGDLNAILNYDQLDYNGNPASAYANDALVHRLRGSTEIHNAELNRLWGVSSGGCCSQWSVHVLAGFRYFSFDENLEFAADTVDTMFTGAVDELYYTIDCDNNLYGGQLGAYIERRLAARWSARFACKAGVFANDASAISHIGGAAGTAIVNNGPNDGREWFVAANKTDAAFLGEVHAGLGFQATQHLRLLADYRVLGVSGVALPTNQVFHDLRGLQDVELLATNGSLLLHGVFVGGQLVY